MGWRSFEDKKTINHEDPIDIIIDELDDISTDPRYNSEQAMINCFRTINQSDLEPSVKSHFHKLINRYYNELYTLR